MFFLCGFFGFSSATGLLEEQDLGQNKKTNKANKN